MGTRRNILEQTLDKLAANDKAMPAPNPINLDLSADVRFVGELGFGNTRELLDVITTDRGTMVGLTDDGEWVEIDNFHSI